ncbi:MAG: DUF790 family protein [Gemmataceae bacterium]
MLTGRQVRIRYARDKIVPQYIDTADAGWIEVATQLLEILRGQAGSTRGQLDEDLKEVAGTDPNQLVHQGLAKLLEDRCEFDVVSGLPPEQVREAVFLAAATSRKENLKTERDDAETPRGGDAATADAEATVPLSPPLRVSASSEWRRNVLADVARALELTEEEIEAGLFADLKSEQRLVRFRDISVERLLQRYNVALAQAVLLRSTRVQVVIRSEPPRRYRQLLRKVKFHRLVCEIERAGRDAVTLKLDGPLSLFSATQKYGMQLALFLPALLTCSDFELEAELLWGPQKKPKKFTLAAADGLVSTEPDWGQFLPAELKMFAELFAKRIDDWELSEDVDLFPLGEGPGSGYWVPDFSLTDRQSGEVVYLEVLGFWRRSGVEKHLERLKQHAPGPFVLALSEQLKVDDEELAGLTAAVHRFKQMPLPDEVAKLARGLLSA